MTKPENPGSSQPALNRPPAGFPAPIRRRGHERGRTSHRRKPGDCNHGPAPGPAVGPTAEVKAAKRRIRNHRDPAARSLRRPDRSHRELRTRVNGSRQAPAGGGRDMGAGRDSSVRGDRDGDDQGSDDRRSQDQESNDLRNGGWGSGDLDNNVRASGIRWTPTGPQVIARAPGRSPTAVLACRRRWRSGAAGDVACPRHPAGRRACEATIPSRTPGTRAWTSMT